MTTAFHLGEKCKSCLKSFVKTNNGIAVGAMMCHIFESFDTEWNEATTKPQPEKKPKSISFQ